MVRPLLPFLLLHSAFYSSALAFSVRYNERRRRLGPTPADFCASSSQLPACPQPQNLGIESVDDIPQRDAFLRRLNASLVTLIAAASIILAPSPSVASSIQQTYSADSSGIWSNSFVVAEDLSSLSRSSITELGLKPPTEEKPQIMLNGGRANQQPSQQTSITRKTTATREPILQGLVYFPERAPTDPNVKVSSGPQVKQQLDYYSDILVLTAVSAAYPEGPELAGAKFPVSSVRFPFSFEMYDANLLTNRAGVKDAWESVAKTGDVILRASICPSDASTFPCDEKETKKSAEGIAKLITNLPGLEEGAVIRAPASLALQ